MASICVHRAPRTPPDSTPGHIDSLDVLQEARRRSPTCQKICQEDLVGLKNSTIEKKLGYLRWFLNWATDRGYNTNLDYKKFHPTLKMNPAEGHLSNLGGNRPCPRSGTLGGSGLPGSHPGHLPVLLLLRPPATPTTRP